VYAFSAGVLETFTVLASSIFDFFFGIITLSPSDFIAMNTNSYIHSPLHLPAPYSSVIILAYICKENPFFRNLLFSRERKIKLWEQLYNIVVGTMGRSRKVADPRQLVSFPKVKGQLLVNAAMTCNKHTFLNFFLTRVSKNTRGC
jgi:hypothetical protein